MKRKVQMLFLLWMLLSAHLPIMSQGHYFGIWQKGAGTNLISKFDSYAAFLADGNQKAQNGLRLIDFEHFKNRNKDQFVGVWRTLHDAQVIVKSNTWREFVDDKQQRAAQGMVLTDFEFHTAKGVRNFVGVYRKGTGQNHVARFTNWNEFVADGNKRAQSGLRLLDFEHFQSFGRQSYLGVWRKGAGTNLITKSNTWNGFKQMFASKAGEGLKLTDFEIVETGGSRKYVGVWRNGNNLNAFVVKNSFADFVADGNERAKKGYRLLDFEFTSTPASMPPPSPNPDPRPNPGGPVTCATLTELPHYIDIDFNGLSLVVDFTTAAFPDNPDFPGESGVPDDMDFPTITIPSFLLEDLPTCNGEWVFPTNFCGLRATNVTRFFWESEQGQVLGDISKGEPTNYISFPNGNVLHGNDGDNWDAKLREGIAFSGPMGACENHQDPYNFPDITRSEQLDPDDHHVRLIIELDPTSSRLEFLNTNVTNEPLELGELYEAVDFDAIVEAAIALVNEIHIRDFVQEDCEQDPLHCPVSDDDQWW